MEAEAQWVVATEVIHHLLQLQQSELLDYQNAEEQPALFMFLSGILGLNLAEDLL